MPASVGQQADDQLRIMKRKVRTVPRHQRSQSWLTSRAIAGCGVYVHVYVCKVSGRARLPLKAGFLDQRGKVRAQSGTAPSCAAASASLRWTTLVIVLVVARSMQSCRVVFDLNRHEQWHASTNVAVSALSESIPDQLVITVLIWFATFRQKYSARRQDAGSSAGHGYPVVKPGSRCREFCGNCCYN